MRPAGRTGPGRPGEGPATAARRASGSGEAADEPGCRSGPWTGRQTGSAAFDERSRSMDPWREPVARTRLMSLPRPSRPGRPTDRHVVVQNVYRMGVVTRDNSRPARSALRFSRAGREGLPARRFDRPFCDTSTRRNDAERGPMESGDLPDGLHRRSGGLAAVRTGRHRRAGTVDESVRGAPPARPEDRAGAADAVEAAKAAPATAIGKGFSR